MKLSAPKMITWIIAVILGIAGIVIQVVPIDALADWAMWIVALGLALLAVATLVKGL